MTDQLNRPVLAKHKEKMTKEEISKEIKEIKNALEKKVLVVGTDRVLKGLRDGSLKKVFISNNCKDSVKEDIKHYAGLQEIPVVYLKEPNDELGTICKKPFSISVLGLKNAKN